jgi:hypothetical protein
LGNNLESDGGMGFVVVRVDDFILRQNIFDDGFAVAFAPRAASGAISTNYIKGSYLGIFV